MNENEEPPATSECSTGLNSVNFGFAQALELELLP
jgi:hypothetical protein